MSSMFFCVELIFSIWDLIKDILWELIFSSLKNFSMNLFGAYSGVDIKMCVAPPVFSASIGEPSSIKQFLVVDKDYLNITGYTKLFTTVLDTQSKVISTEGKVYLNCRTPIYEYGGTIIFPNIFWAEGWTIDENGKYDFIFGCGSSVYDFDITITGDTTAEGPFVTDTTDLPENCYGPVLPKISGTWIAKEYIE